MDGLILAIDLGRFNSVLLWYDSRTKAPTFRTTPTTPTDLRRELLRRPVVRVVVEACSPAGWVHDLCGALHLPCDVASTTGPAWQWKRVKRKTDRDDALKLARLAAVGELAAVTVPPRAVRQWKSLIGLRGRLVGE
jgi:transposase